MMLSPSSPPTLYFTNEEEEKQAIEMKQVSCWKNKQDRNNNTANNQILFKTPIQSLEWNSIILTVPSNNNTTGEKKKILNGVSGRICPGETIAVMGTSGCGKTSLLNLLAGGWSRAKKEKRLDGSITINGIEPDKSSKRYIAFVPQEDVLLSNLSVRQTLSHAALLRRPLDISRDEQKQRMLDLATTLGIESCLDTLVSSISGGQRRRLNVALELLSDPSLIICDEPTSGLDSSTAAKLIQTFRTLADGGKSIICSIHQPSSQVYELFDKVMLLSQGRVVYYGHASQAREYFASINFPCKPNWNTADFMLDIASDPNLKISIGSHDNNDNNNNDKSLADIYQLVRDKSLAEEKQFSSSSSSSSLSSSAAFSNDNRSNTLALDINIKITTEKDNNNNNNNYISPWPTTWFEQFTILLKRCFQQKKGEIITLHQTIRIQSVAIIAALVWFQLPLTMEHAQDRYGSLFFVISFWFMSAMMSATMTFPAERRVIQKERRNRMYRLSAYYAAKAISELPIQMFYPITFVTLYYWVIGFETSVNFLVYAGCILLLVLCGDSLGLMISNLVSNVADSIITCNVATIFFLMFAGFYAKISYMPVWIRWASYLGFPRYIFSILAQRELQGVIFECPSSSSSSSSNNNGTSIIDDQCTPMTGNQMLHDTGLDELTQWQSALIVIGMTVAFRVLAYIALNKMTRV